MDRNEKRKQKTREQIINKSIELFLEKGIDNVPFDEIAYESDLARGTLYNHFQNKEELIFSILNPMFLKNEEYITALIISKKTILIDDILDLCLQLWKKHKNTLRLAYTAKFEQMGNMGDTHKKFIQDFIYLFTSLANSGDFKINNAQTNALLVYKLFIPTLEIISSLPEYEALFKQCMKGLILK